MEYNQIPEQVRIGAENADKLIAAQKAEEDKTAGIKPIIADPQDQDPAKLDPEHTENKPIVVADVDKDKKIADLQHKFDVLQGKYNSEIKALRDDPQLLNTLKAENRRLERERSDYMKIVADQEEKLARQPIDSKKELANPNIESSKLEEVLSEEELEHMSNEGIDDKTLAILNKLIAHRSGKEAEMRYGKVSEEIKSLKTDKIKTDKEMFDEKLDAAVPNWREIDEDPGWRSGFLMKMDKYNTYTYDQILQKAAKSFDAKTVINLLKDYIDESKLSSNNDNTKINTEGKTVQKLNTLPNVKPEDMLDIESSEASGSLEEKPTYTEQQYKKHTSEYNRGKWQGRLPEWQKVMDVLDTALNEGRVT